MAQYLDLSSCNYFPFESENLLAVGWLSKDSDFPTGDVDEDFHQKLCNLLIDPWAPVILAGGHQCELCQFQGPTYSKNLFIPYKNKIYVAPEAIIHYIAQHWYQPPSIFIEAVNNCPEMKSLEYRKYLLDNGGRELLKKIKD